MSVERTATPCACGDHVFGALTKGYVTLLDPKDAHYLDNGRWYARVARNTVYANGYTQKKEKIKRIVPLHREVTNCPDDKLVDHINGCGLDNRKRNLRPATNAQNIAASRRKKIGKTGYLGVWGGDRGRYRACLSVDDKLRYFGRHNCPTVAAIVRDKNAIELYGKFAVLNFPFLAEFPLSDTGER